MKSNMIDQYEILEEFIDSRRIIQKAKTGKGEEICVKIIKKSHQKTEQQMRLERERDICRKLKTIEHQNIIKYYDIIEKEDKIYFFMEYCPTTLDKYVESQQFTYKNYLDLLYQISSGYKKLIELDIIHRDIKLENIVLKEDQSGKLTFKIIDFGTSKLIGQVCPGQISRAETKNIGTQLYMAPEILKCNQENYDNSCDIYSLGIIIVLIMCGKEDIAKEKWVSKVRQNIEEKSIKEFIQIKNSVPSQIVDIVDCMVTARKWRISWEYLNIRMEQLRFQIIEEKNQNLITPKKAQNTLLFDDIPTAKKSGPDQLENYNSFIQNDQQYYSEPIVNPQPKEETKQKKQVFSQPFKKFNNQLFLNNQLKFENNNNTNFVPSNIKCQNSIYQNPNQFCQPGQNTERTPEIKKNIEKSFHQTTESKPQPNFLKKAQNKEQVSNLINQQIKQDNSHKQFQKNINFEKTEQNLNNQNQIKSSQKSDVNTIKDNIQIKNQFNLGHFRSAQQLNQEQNFKINQSFVDQNQQGGRISHQHQHQQTFIQNQLKNIQTMNH